MLDPDKLEALLQRALVGPVMFSAHIGQKLADLITARVMEENARGGRPSTPEAESSHYPKERP